MKVKITTKRFITCPGCKTHQHCVDILQDVVAVYGPSGDADQHGMIRYVAGIEDTPETRERIGINGVDHSLKKVFELFDTNGEPIDSDYPETSEGLISALAAMRREENKKS